MISITRAIGRTFLCNLSKDLSLKCVYINEGYGLSLLAYDVAWITKYVIERIREALKGNIL
jgi:hypothetical protein